jgi:hypothetical protein
MRLRSACLRQQAENDFDILVPDLDLLYKYSIYFSPAVPIRIREDRPDGCCELTLVQEQNLVRVVARQPVGRMDINFVNSTDGR